MAEPLIARLGIPPHPAHRKTTRDARIGIVAMLVGVGIYALIGVPTLCMALFVLGGFLTFANLRRRARNATQHLLNRAVGLLFDGRFADAKELLDHTETTTRLPAFLRLLDIHRTVLALRQGALKDGLRHADGALSQPLGRNSHDEQPHVSIAQGLRALLRASTGDDDGARRDTEAVLGNAHATPEALARAELATAISLERAGDRTALATHLQARRTLLLEHTHPRERAIVRGYLRMLKARTTSIYRETAEQPPSDEPPNADWLTQLAPGAAPFVPEAARRTDDGPRAPGPSTSTRTPATPRVDPTARAAAEERTKTPRSQQWIWITVIALPLIALTLALDPFDANPTPAPTATAPLAQLGSIVLFYVFPIAVFLTLIGFFLVQKRRYADASIATTLGALARGEESAAIAELTRISDTRALLFAAQAHLTLAGWHDRRADFPAALRHCDAALSKLTSPLYRELASDLLFPGILAERASLLAITGRVEDAEAEYQLLAEQFPLYAYLNATRLRLDLTLAGGRGDLAAVAALAERIGNLPLSPRDELLAELGRAAAHPDAVGANEIARLQTELRDLPEYRRWLDAVAPQVLTAFSQLGQTSDLGETDADTPPSATER
ncbi:hypothetical protein [Chondromyces crocatus]|uniref:Uncharacterized protein n=1 Tax=Chondromyces crocatus TaxID=52 RepID=A0A0K1EAV9_CHOCO|nr:hypothetical protein [Chondromyces crocatus]AKT37989.1 uncharacterized protein CMC5_021300 [Chondromyces crocatus]